MSGLAIHQKLVNKGVKRDTLDYPTVKTVNGKEVGELCVTCGVYLDVGSWLCGPCVTVIGHDNINDTVNNMPEYLSGNQYEKWLKLKLNKFRYETN